MQGQIGAFARVAVNVDVYGFEKDAIQSIEDYWRMQRRRALGKVTVYHDRGHNLAVNSGLDAIAALTVNAGTTYARYTGVGTSSSAASASQTALLAETGSRVQGSGYYVSTGTARLDSFYGAGDANATWNEVGLFSASASGTMFARRVLSTAFVKATTNAAVIAWQLTFVGV